MWPEQLVVGVMVHQRLREVDTEGLWTYHPPEMAAAEDDIASAEDTLGHALDPRYRAFLTYANGWRGFYGDAMLFGTAQLMGAPPMDTAREILDSALAPDDVISASGLTAGETIPIGAGDGTINVFLLARPDSTSPGTVVWTAGATVEEYPDFDAFFLAMLDVNRYQIAQLEREHRSDR